jgi:hypothetical protein
VLAKALQEAAAPEDALMIAEAGLGLAGDVNDEMDGSVIPLAHWLREYAGGIGKSALALKAAREAFDHSLSIEDFGAVKVLGGDAWEAIRKDLLAHLARAPHAFDRTRIYLSEGLFDDAVRSVGDRFGHGARDETLMRLAAAAHTSHPDRVIRLAWARQQASWMPTKPATMRWRRNGSRRPRSLMKRWGGGVESLPGWPDRSAPPPQVQAASASGGFAGRVGG